ncbi:MAG: ribbon-helix-helix protein, CopG family, partial [Planctomycetia bacterium]
MLYIISMEQRPAMIKTQIQIPDDLYRRVKRLAESQEWSLAETLRRAAELLLAVRPAGAGGGGKT